jgi:hypothetical protein
MQPRLGLNDGFIRVYQPATDRYAAYSYDWDQDVTRLDYGTNADGLVSVKVLRLKSEKIDAVTIDDQPVEFKTETVGHDTYTVVAAPGGQHTIEIIKVSVVVQPAALEIGPAEEKDSAPESRPPQPSVAPNLVPSPETSGLQPQPSAEIELVEAADASTAKPVQASLPTRTEQIAARNAHETRLAVLQFASASLIILTCLTLMVLVAIRRLHRLN